jgi:nitrogen fixation/metabolism regulation signal transduction histidine kinase
MRLSIRFKIVSIIVIVLLLGAGTTLYVSLRSQRESLLAAAQNTLSVNTDILNTVIRNIMLAGSAPVAQRTMASLATLEGFQDAAVYRTDGSVAFNDYSTIEAVNKYQKQQFERTPRTELRMLKSAQFDDAIKTSTPVIVENRKARELEYYFPIINSADCRQCHGYAGFIRGVAHFKISIAGIYDRIASAGRLLSALFAVMSVAIAGVLVLALNRVIIAPILGVGETVTRVGAGDLGTTVSVRSRDELGALGEQLNGMISGLRERSQLIVENERIETRNRENRKYLDNIQEGLLLLGRDHVVSEQYSRYIVSLFATERIAGRSFEDFVYPDPEKQAQERKELGQFLDMLLNNVASDMEMLQQINPLRDARLRVAADDGSAREIVVDAVFHRIVGPDGTVENVMVIFQDKTEITRVQQELAVERQRSQGELEQIASILRAGPEAFADFERQAAAAVDETEMAASDRAALGDRASVDRLFRSLHSLKGLARYLELRQVADAAHRAEEVLGRLRSGDSTPAQAAQDLSDRGRLLADELDLIRKLNDRFRSFASQDRDPKRRSADLVESLRRMAVDLAGQLGKKVEVRGVGALADAELLAKLRDPLIHMVRNALDHGIEEPYDRIGAGKPEQGTVTVRFAALGADGAQVIEVQDDGRGIDFEQVRARAFQLKLLRPQETAPTRGRLLGILFAPGYSTRQRANDVSGRGVGLDVVKATVASLGGEIGVATQKGKGTRFTIRVPAATARSTDG